MPIDPNSTNIEMPQMGGGILSSKAAKLGLGFSTGGTLGGLAAAAPNSPLGKGFGMYSTGNQLPGMFSGSNPAAGATNDVNDASGVKGGNQWAGNDAGYDALQRRQNKYMGMGVA